MFLVQSARDEFGVTGASISFVDTDLEILKVEVGYNRRSIKRPESIAAHVLLSTEVLVILDTEKDWRFSGNPLVNNEPRIRFFAGAPLLSASGEVVGVFAIFSPEPRTEFNATQRRRLSDYSTTAVADLAHILSDEDANMSTNQFDQIESDESSTQPIPRRASNISAISQTHTQCPIGRNQDITQRDSGSSQQSKHTMRNENCCPGVLAPKTVEYTPPPSDQEGSPILRATAFGKNHKNLSVTVPYNACSNHKQGSSLESQEVGQYSPRPFSGSDLMSVDGNPHPNTPADWAITINDLSFPQPDDVLAQTSTLDCSSFRIEEENSATSDLPWGCAISEKLSRGETWTEDNLLLMGNAQNAFVASCHAAERNQILGSIHTDTFSIGSAPTNTTTPHTSISANSVEFVEDSVRAEADFAAKYAAHSLGFDRVYVARFTPRKLFSTAEELLNGGMEVEILGCHNCPEDTQLDIAIHLHVIRSRSGAVKWQDVDAGPGSQTKGFLMRLSPKVKHGIPQRQQNGGIVYGAFRAAPLNASESPAITQQEQLKLAAAANAMKRIVLRQPKKALKRAQLEQMSPPTSPEMVAYPANEAKEVDIDDFGLEGRVSLDYAFRAVEEELNLAWDRDF